MWKSDRQSGAFLHIAVLSTDKKLYTEIYQPGDMHRCSVCGASFSSRSNRSFTAWTAGKRITLRQTAERMRELRAIVTTVGAKRALLYAVLWAEK